MRQILSLALMIALPIFSTPARADETSDATDILAARKLLEPMFGKDCEFGYEPDGTPSGDNNAYPISYRSPGQEQDSPDKKLTLLEIHCYSAAYNFSSLYVMRDPERNTMTLLSFPEPVMSYDYTDENFTHLKAPPKVTGFTASNLLTNPEYDAETMTLTSAAKWRGIGDAGSNGQWKFVDGNFVLKKFEVDPTYQDNSEAEQDPNEPESYVVYDAGDAPTADETP